LYLSGHCGTNICGVWQIMSCWQFVRTWDFNNILISCGAATQREPWFPHFEVCRLHKTKHHTWENFSEWWISPTQKPLPDHTKHSNQTEIHDPGRIRTHNPNKRAVDEPRLRPRGHWDWWIITLIYELNNENYTVIRYTKREF